MTIQEEIRPGYKQTEVGVIPEDWEIVLLGQLVQITSGESPSRFQFISEGVPYFKVEQLNNSRKYLSEDSTPYHFVGESSVPAGSVIFAKRGAAIALNRVRIIVQMSFMDTNLMVLTPTERLDHEYLFYSLSYAGLSRFADTTSVPQINNKHIIPILFLVPPLPEQRAIAAALSDADGLIAALEALIAKKRDLKQAAMQQLLTGKTRLPGFSGDWEVKRLGEVGEIDPGNLGAGTDPDYSFKYISLEDVNKGKLLGFSEMEFHSAPSRARRKIRCDDVLVSTVRPNLQAHLHFRQLSQNWICSTGFAVLRCIAGKSNAGFIFQHLFGHCIVQQIDMLITGSSYPAINSRDVRSLEISTPPVEEQTAIAEVLSDMDADLAALEAQSDKAKEIKQGMMQELLTGKVRLV